MSKNKSEYKRIFEDNSLSDLQKYRKISNLQNKVSRFWSVVIGLNAIIWPLLYIIPNIEIDKPNINPIVALKDWKNKVLPLILLILHREGSPGLNFYCWGTVTLHRESFESFLLPLYKQLSFHGRKKALHQQNFRIKNFFLDFYNVDSYRNPY